MIRKTCNNTIFFVDERVETNIILKEQENEVSIYELKIKGESPLNNVEIIIPYKMEGILSTYAPTNAFKRNRMVMQWFAPISSQSNFYYGSPFLSVIDRGNINFATIALSDSVMNNEIMFYVQDFQQEGNVEFKIKLITGREQLRNYSVELRIDRRKQCITNSLNDLTDWFRKKYNNTIDVPEVCYMPLYSTWYNFHQHPNAELLEKELKIAKEMGFESVIIDDGWQYDGNGTSDYIDCGDWSISSEKFPDFKNFINNVHALGMKVALWFPLPFVGFHTKAYKRFRNKLLYEEALSTNAGILDPRYKEVREFISETIVGLFKNYNLDGLKLDFIDSFMIKEDTPDVKEDMDEPLLTNAVQALLGSINEKIFSIKHNAMIEYRQNYVGPAITQYCNMLRVADCAFDSITNRIAINDMRLLNDKLAIHSDMLYWHCEDTNENVATQLNNVLFSVPQISVLLSEDSDGHKEVLKNYLIYWKENQKLLVENKLFVEGMDSNYSCAFVENDTKKIVVLYTKNSIKYEDKQVEVINASNYEELFIEGNKAKTAYSYDCLGNLVEVKDLYAEINKIVFKLGGKVIIS